MLGGNYLAWLIAYYGDAIAKRVPVIRSVAFSYPEAESPCPH